ncbi:MAG: class I SAM-dependent methyltransferase [Candidatus Omnitrophota bacterium]|nr:class I SAM-dependent methyltransferase [Candidatus Omnitrophota bacterium]MDZ4241434.1 class I SAM-dependent methyltransferase [Candidatus Omnitrophota bacterium]
MKNSDSSYFINNPVFLKYKTRMRLAPPFGREEFLKSVFVNERIVEIPFAIACLSALPKGSKILDLGCTESTFPLQAACLGYRVTGFDFRPYPYTHPSLEFVQGDIVNLPFPPASFDAVFCISTIEHIGIGFYADPLSGVDADHQAAGEAGKVLKTGGILVLTVPYGAGQANKHHRIYDQKTLAALLKDFRVQELRYFVNSRFPEGRANSWIEVGEKDAAVVESGESANGVCLVKAAKP